MAEPRKWSVGDRVLHPRQPDWGVGRVKSCQPASHEGRACQRLTVLFDRSGSKTISTAFVELQEVSEIMGQSHTESEPREELGTRQLSEALATIPESAVDPFRPAVDRLTETLRWYRFESSGRSLLDWAMALSRVQDPLSILNRHELERAFDGFYRKLDAVLLDVGRRVMREDRAGFQRIAQDAPARAKRTLAMVIAGR
ncbi:MAG: DUF3553 domain-containing protein [Phycisphaeraceae bacterium]|nr:DUF3553 domain-containing protein [Phycisphaeraceae bacterium]